MAGPPGAGLGRPNRTRHGCENQTASPHAQQPGPTPRDTPGPPTTPPPRCPFWPAFPQLRHSAPARRGTRLVDRGVSGTLAPSGESGREVDTGADDCVSSNPGAPASMKTCLPAVEREAPRRVAANRSPQTARSSTRPGCRTNLQKEYGFGVSGSRRGDFAVGEPFGVAAPVAPTHLSRSGLSWSLPSALCRGVGQALLRTTPGQVPTRARSVGRLVG